MRLTSELVLENVLFVPQFQFNLLSVSALTKNNSNMSLSFFSHTCVIQDVLHSKMIGKGRLVEGLYALDADCCVPQKTTVDRICNSVDTIRHVVSCDTWHKRLGHLSLDRLNALNFPSFCKDTNNVPCLVCPLAKQRRLSFASNNNMSKFAFNLVHCDTWGPYHTPTHARYIYFLTLVDDCTRYTWIFLMRHKSDARSIIPKFFSVIETQFNTKIKSFRSDNALELLFTEYFASKGVVHQFSCVERLEQNSVVERKHQHLLNVARALFFQSRVPIKFWGECVLTAAYLINRILAPILHHQSPYQAFYHTDVDYGFLRVFGSLCFASTLPSHRTKFQPQATTCVFLGYPPRMKGYKVYDIVNKVFFVACDVVFHEDSFPFHTITASADLVDPFPVLVLPKPASDLFLVNVEPTAPSSPSSPTGVTSHSLSIVVPSIPVRRSTRAI